MSTWQNVLEVAGVFLAMFLVFAGLWFGFPGPAFRCLLHRIARTRRGTS